MTEPDYAALENDLKELLGPRGVSRDSRQREKASVDGARMSPIIAELLPLGIADLVAFPTTAEEITGVVAAAVRHRVPVTPRGKGTGNYGQAIPMSGGLVLDMSRARTVIGVSGDTITADAGVPITALEQAARAAGRQLWMYPSTVHSTIGGFLSGGSGGTGTILHGSNDAGFVAALDVVTPESDGELLHVEGDEAQGFVHNYGTAGIIARATVRLEPAQDWRGLYASFADFAGSLSVLRKLGRLQPAPRLVSADTPHITAQLPPDDAFPAGRSSLRMIVDASIVAEATAIIEGAGGRIEDVREGPSVSAALSVLSYNHPIEWLQKSEPGVYFHVEVSGDALVERIDEVHAVYPGGLLHIEAGHTVPIGMLAGIYESPEAVYAGIEKLGELGVGVHNPHQWNVDFRLQETLELAQTTDPQGLLNPGKLNPEYAGPTKGAIR
ncbi:FAD/FMN-containing dehydrogenase [Microbacterium endophyticum]|uniref:FAD/FMN-containing dehydrogenase n=1 Tax=Microbacterium endophyticum TaxID=1526412 RepID=A0A7W4V2M4_9MICO|nr:FAD-binding oxidoreductase [Microbacterium endophyticum]MBB2975675.1 FAD/FMN-containing dehydrogenase [Microbacterium endophyticum]NIK35306.1 FAD/FMN-containing dehydrogenase [Microbacterium endophyticum]